MAAIAVATIGLGFIPLHPEGLLNRHSDLLAEVLTTQDVVHRSWQGGHGWPLWRTDLLSGAPALTNPQALYSHPVHWLFAFFEPKRVVGLVIWLQMVIAALGGYWAGSILRLSMPGRLMVAFATLFSFKTILAAYAGWLPVLSGLAAMPLLFAAVGALLARPTIGNTVVAGLIGALALHSGHPQIVYYAVLFITIWVIGVTVRLFARGERSHALQTARSLGGGAALALGTSAYILIPIVLDARDATRGAADYAFFLGVHPLTAADLLTAISPERFGTPLANYVEGWEYIFYCGAVPSLLAVFAAIYGRRRHFTVTLLIALALSLVLAIDTPLLRVTYDVVPGFALFRLPARMLFLSAFFVFCLAGIGLDLLIAAAGSSRTRQVIAVVLLTSVAAEGAYWARRYLKTPAPIPYPVAAEFVTALQRGETPSRIAPLSRTTPAYGFVGAFGLESIAGYDPFNTRQYQIYMDVLRDGRALPARPEVWTDITRIRRYDLLAALNVRDLVSDRPVDVPASDYVLEAEFRDQPQFQFYEGIKTGPVYIYRNVRFLPRAFFATEVRPVSGIESMIREVEHADLRETAVAMTPEAGGRAVLDAGDRVSIVHAAAGQLDLSVKTSRRRFVVISEIWHPGWSAVVDGTAGELVRTNIALQGIWIDAGDHTVSLRFWPPGLTTGLVISGASACVVALLLLLRQSRRRREA